MSGRPTLLAVSVAVLSGDRVLLVQRGRQPSRGVYAFPGGRVEPGETLEAAARRELFEETALTVGPLEPLIRLTIQGETEDFDLQVFSASSPGGEARAGSDADALGFFDLVQMAKLAVAPSVLKVAEQLLAAASREADELPPVPMD